MMRRTARSSPLLGAAALAVAGLLVNPASAAPDATVSRATPAFTWETQTPASVNVANNVAAETGGAVSNCISAEFEAQVCDVKMVHLDVADATNVEIKIEFDATTDYDLYLYDAKGREIGNSAAWIYDGSTSETLRLRLKGGEYRVEVVKFLAANSTLKGSFKIR